jgi:hypothetical protein
MKNKNRRAPEMSLTTTIITILILVTIGASLVVANDLIFGC